MKRKVFVTILAVIMVLTMAACAQTEPVQDDVYVMTSSTTEIPQSEMTTKTEYVYDSKGNLLQEFAYDNGKLYATTSATEFDEAGCPTKLVQTDTDGIEIAVYNQNWSESGVLLRREAVMNGEVSQTMEYEIDINNNVTKATNTIVFVNKVTEVEYSRDEDGKIISATTKTNGEVSLITEYTYDDHGRKLKETQTTGSGEVQLVIEYVYDDEANRHTEIRTSPNGVHAEGYAVVTYDEAGNVTLTENYVDGELTIRTTQVWAKLDAE